MKSNTTKINDFIYAQCVTYIDSRGGENPRPCGVDRKENPPRVVAAPLVCPGKGRHISLCVGLCIRRRQPSPLYMPKPNTI
jgi:hypothetical protein